MATITVDDSATLAYLASAANQIPFATSTAINDLAFQVQRAENAAMLAVFKHPRPFTAKSVQVDKSTKASMTAVVCVRPEVAKYLQPYETGGLHVLPGKALLNPRAIPLDPYGQLSKGTMARLRARADIFIGTIATKKGPVTGVWQRLSITTKGNQRRKRVKGGRMFTPALGALKLLIQFGDAVPVKAHLDFVKRATDLINANAPAAFKTALTKALANMR